MKIIRTILTCALFATLPAMATFTASAAENVQARVEVSVLPTVKVSNGRVEITIQGDESRQVLVYALTGQLVKTVTASPGTTAIELPAGYYIVKCDRLSQRVIVR